MATLGLTEILILAVLPLLGLLIAAFGLALAAFIKVRRLERQLGASRDWQNPRA